MNSITPHVLQNLLPYRGEAYYDPSFLTKEESNRFFLALKSNIHWNQEEIWMFGRRVMQPRLTALYGDPSIPYGYSGITMQSLPFTELLAQLKKRLDTLAQTTFTHVLLNYYRNGADSMGWHRDNEKVLGSTPIIASVSLGAERRFQFRYYENKSIKIDLMLASGSLLLMKGESQRYWEHQLPKAKRVSLPRINLTFRVIQSTKA
ncbi:alpha-ketoglutarate-dependent dioxygenase AlkB family protein [Lunatimonas salinarum]|uniref:alpha-ketoglutarate-dependent dioxygenase AlkB family protein n=1 Tax=Lunatimonas salinarum TaxID=1774590 RepID=UPI001ADF4F8B|nr:alpha-ketoglutarate-dependent dioxygenase AlkB [Lunatimonas salinarum]